MTGIMKKYWILYIFQAEEMEIQIAALADTANITFGIKFGVMIMATGVDMNRSGPALHHFTDRTAK